LHIDRLNILWAILEDELPSGTPDEIRNVLGLTHLLRGESLVCFYYTFGASDLRSPTAMEAMGGWAFWPARPGETQQTVDYKTGKSGPKEFVHAASVPPATMRLKLFGILECNWDT
jgi:hypothetical protein